MIVIFLKGQTKQERRWVFSPSPSSSLTWCREAKEQGQRVAKCCISAVSSQRYFYAVATLPPSCPVRERNKVPADTRFTHDHSGWVACLSVPARKTFERERKRHVVFVWLTPSQPNQTQIFVCGQAGEHQIRRSHRGERPADPGLWLRGPGQDLQLLREEPARIPDAQGAAPGGRRAPFLFAFSAIGKNAAGRKPRECFLFFFLASARAPWLEVGCGLALILALSLAVSALYRVFRLELLLLYRSRFGADERHTGEARLGAFFPQQRSGSASRR